MLIAVIQKATFAELRSALATLDTSLYTCIELRLDALDDLNIEELQQLIIPLPAIFTLRCPTQGGMYQYDEATRLATLERLIALQPAYIDLEDCIALPKLQKLTSLATQTTIILSHHNFDTMPKNLHALLASMQSKVAGAIYKIAGFANSSIDALQMLLFCKSNFPLCEKAGGGLIGIAMGQYGACTRILAPVVHSGFCYCPVAESSAPGQIDATTLLNTYNFSTLSRTTAIFGLLGDPVEQSIGHAFHNKRNAATHTDAVYVKWQVTADEIPTVLPLLYALGVQGLSVTMPLKQAVMPHTALVDMKDTGSVEKMGAVNTLLRKDTGAKQWFATNTDAPAALAMLDIPFAGKAVILLGAGGAAYAIIAALVEVGARVTVFNRTTDKQLPDNLPIYPLADITDASINKKYAKHDVIINTLPFEVDFPFDSLPFVPNSIAFDISYAGTNAFLQAAKKHGCKIIDGSGMFTHQANLQRLFWGIPQ